MSKKLFYLLFVLLIANKALCQEKSLPSIYASSIKNVESSHKQVQFLQKIYALGLTDAKADELRRVVTDVSFEGKTEYNGFIFERSGKFSDHLKIYPKSSKKAKSTTMNFVEISEADFLCFIRTLEKNDWVQTGIRQTSDLIFSRE